MKTKILKQFTSYLALLLLITVLACNNNQDRSNVKMASDEMVIPVTEQQPTETIERKLIKEGRVEFETDNLNTTRKTIFEAVNKYKGYVFQPAILTTF